MSDSEDPPGQARRRPPINVRVSEESYDAWMGLCAQTGTTITGLLDSIGLALSEGDAELARCVLSAVPRALRLDAERRSRRR